MRTFRNNKNVVVTAVASAAFVVTISSCVRDQQSPGYEYMPDMYRSPAIEAYVDYGLIRDTMRSEFVNQMSARLPAEGTVPVSDNIINDMPYPFPNTFEGYEAAGELLKSPLKEDAATIERGKVLYETFCDHCHGGSGKGDGPVIDHGHPPPPAYDGPLKNLPEGKMFHVVTYGKGMMGPHDMLLTKTERWEVVAYVKVLQGTLEMPTDTAEAAEDAGPADMQEHPNTGKDETTIHADEKPNERTTKAEPVETMEDTEPTKN